jgi:hypothetical protein
VRAVSTLVTAQVLCDCVVGLHRCAQIIYPVSVLFIGLDARYTGSTPREDESMNDETDKAVDPYNMENPLGDAMSIEARATSMRRFGGVAMLFSLGGLMLYLAITEPPQSVGWHGFLVLFGLAVLYVADKMRRATSGGIKLTKDGLFTSEGEKIVGLENVKTIERGVFAFKPSHGFTVTLYQKETRGWAPGLWWRFGRRVGVGGVIHASQTKLMAEVLAAMTHQRNVEAAND